MEMKLGDLGSRSEDILARVELLKGTSAFIKQLSYETSREETRGILGLTKIIAFHCTAQKTISIKKFIGL